MGAESLSIARLAPLIEARDVTSEEVTRACLERIAGTNPSLNAFITVLPDALERAREADQAIAQGRYRGPLHGIPISIKDLFDVRGVPTTAASRVRTGHVAAQDSPTVARLRDAGAILVGKCNLHEFAFGTTSEDSAYGPVRHPLDPSRSPGGSSGGSAVSVAAGMACASIGTDTGGSIRIPAAACGLVGLKPSFGELSTDGVVPLSRTLDHVGPICRTVEDATLVFAALGGRTDTPSAVRPRSDVRLGVLREFASAPLDGEVAAAFSAACKRLEAAGVVLDDVTLPHAADGAAVYLHIVLAEAAAFHGPTLDSRPDDYTRSVRLRLEAGRYVLAEDYVRAMAGRDVLRAEVTRALEGRDGLLLPSLAIPAPLIGAPTITLGTRTEPIRSVMLRLTQLFNVTGHPALSLPCGRTATGLPVGAQLVGHRDATGKLLKLARGIEAPLLGPDPGQSRA